MPGITYIRGIRKYLVANSQFLDVYESTHLAKVS